MTPEKLQSLTVNDIEQGPFPLRDLLNDSLFYPASGIDGTPIRYWIPGILSFVYVDTSVTKTTYEYVIHNEPPKGYSVLAYRYLNPSDLAPNGYEIELHKDIDAETYISRMHMVGASPATSFALWTVFERDENLNDDHGPARFSLLFIRAEAIATYQAIFIGNQVCPHAIAILRPGTGFGGNYSNFEEVMKDVIQSNPAGMPRLLMQWHESNSDSIHPDAPWDTHYRDRIIGPLKKDNDQGFSISVYSLQN
jgi:hypothetical protein